LVGLYCLLFSLAARLLLQGFFLELRLLPRQDKRLAWALRLRKQSLAPLA